MSTFDPTTAPHTMAPNLTNADRLKYVVQEREFIEELLEDAGDCKWVYQALIECAQLQIKLDTGHTAERKEEISQWLSKLSKLDPLRQGRWSDLRLALQN